MTTVAGLLAEGAAALAAAGIESPRAEARLLLDTATGLSRTSQAASPDATVSAPCAQAYRALLARRAAREPMAYLRGKAEFWSLEFLVEPGVLVPRADTETLVEVATRLFPDSYRALRLLDIGVGSGCLLLTLLRLYPAARGVGIDTSAVALALAGRNAAQLGVANRTELVAPSWADGVPSRFNLIVSNPPYIPTAEIDHLQPEVARFEPRAALDGGPDGLDAHRAILEGLPRLLAPEGVCLLEIGRGQEDQLLPLAMARGFAVAAHVDLAGITRCLELRSPPSPA